MDIELAQDRGAGVNEPMRRVRRNDDNAACFYLALFVTDRDGGSAFESECDFDVGMFVQRRALPGLSLDDVVREGCAVSFADELIRHPDKRQLLEIDKAHGGNLQESLRNSWAPLIEIGPFLIEYDDKPERMKR
jgi:hypothetical protein